MFIIFILGFFVGIFGNGFVGIFGRFFVIDWNIKKIYISIMFWESILLLKKKKMLF